MTIETSPTISKKALWAGRIMSALPILLLLFSAVMKFMKPPPVVEGFAHLGFPKILFCRSEFSNSPAPSFT